MPDKTTTMATTLGATAGVAGLPDVIDAVNYVATSLHMQPMQPSVIIGFITIASVAAHALYMLRTGKAPAAAPKAPPAVPPAAAAALLVALLGFGALSGCASTGQAPWTPAQTAYFELQVGTAAENIAAGVEADQPACAKTAIQVAGQALAKQLQASVPVLTNGGSTAQQLEAAGISGLLPVVNSLGNLITSCSVTPSANTAQAALLAGGMDALQQLPAVVGAVVELNGGWQPAAADIANAQAALAAAAAKL